MSTATLENTAHASLASAEDLRAALHAPVRAAAHELFEEFADCLPTTLLSVTQTTERDTREIQEMTRRRKIEQEQWAQSFADNVIRLFNEGLTTDEGEEAPQSARDVSMAKALVFAETKYVSVIAEIEARLKKLRLQTGVAGHSKAIAPTGLHRALEHTAIEHGWPKICRVAIQAAFQQVSFAALGDVYEAVLARLRELAQEALPLAEAESAPAVEAPAPSKPEAPAKRGEFAVPSDLGKTDPETTAMLRSRALSNADGDGGYDDSLLATDMLALTEGRPLPGLGKEQQWAPLQRMNLAGHFLNEATADTAIAMNLAENRESLRFPLIKTAMVDSTIFTAEIHPLRGLIDELLQCAASFRLTQNAEAQRLAKLLGEVIEHFDLAPDFVRESMATAKPLDDTQIARFYALQKEQAEKRREFVRNEARQMVADEVERSCFGRNIPPRGTQFIERLWTPLLCQRLIRLGASHNGYKTAVLQLDQLIDLLDERQPAQSPTETWTALVREMAHALVASGLPKAQAPKVLALLEMARKDSGCYF